MRQNNKLGEVKSNIPFREAHKSQSRCNNLSCDMCDRYIDITLTQSEINKQFINWHCSNFQKRLLCLLIKNGLGKVYKQEEIIKFVWNDNGFEPKYGSVNQIIHQAKKELNSKWDIGNLRGRGYFLYRLNAKKIIVKL